MKYVHYNHHVLHLQRILHRRDEVGRGDRLGMFWVAESLVLKGFKLIPLFTAIETTRGDLWVGTRHTKIG